MLFYVQHLQYLSGIATPAHYLWYLGSCSSRCCSCQAMLTKHAVGRCSSTFQQEDILLVVPAHTQPVVEIRDVQPAGRVEY